MKNKIKLHAISLFFGGLAIQFYQVFWGNNVVDLILGFLMVIIAVANFYTLDLLNFGTVLKASRKVKFAFIQRYRFFHWFLLAVVILLYLSHLNVFNLFNEGIGQLIIPGVSLAVVGYGLTFMLNQNVQFLKSKLF